MKLKHTIFSIVLLLGSFTFCFSQDNSCPKVLDQNIVIYQPTPSKVFCEYDEFGKCSNSYDRTPWLEEQLVYFDTRFRDNGIEVFWKSKIEFLNNSYSLLRSKDGKQFFEIAKLNAADFKDGEFKYLDHLPDLGNNFYLLKKSETDKTLISATQSVFSSNGVCHLETMDIKNKTSEKVSATYFSDAAGSFQILVTDSNGNEFVRKTISIKTGKNEIDFQMSNNGMYFITLTNGFSSVTDLFVQSNGKDGNSKSISKADEAKKNFD